MEEQFVTHFLLLLISLLGLEIFVSRLHPSKYVCLGKPDTFLGTNQSKEVKVTFLHCLFAFPLSSVSNILIS
jgi:hypothetical protein